MLDAATFALCRRAYALVGTRPYPSTLRMERSRIDLFRRGAASIREAWAECLEIARQTPQT